LSDKQREEIIITNMCTVFAESEAISLIAQNKEKADIIYGLCNGVACKTISLMGKVGKVGEYMMTGGVANNYGVVNAIEKMLGERIIIYDQPRNSGGNRRCSDRARTRWLNIVRIYFKEEYIMAKEAAKTGVAPTTLVAIEQYFPKKERIIEDDLAHRILPSGSALLCLLLRPNSVRAWMVRATEKDFPGMWGGMMCRKRYIDEKLIDSLNQIDAVVNLGAGYDTRVYRLPALSDHTCLGARST